MSDIIPAMTNIDFEAAIDLNGTTKAMTRTRGLDDYSKWLGFSEDVESKYSILDRYSLINWLLDYTPSTNLTTNIDYWKDYGWPLQRWISHTETLRNYTILDAGCGAGNFMLELQEHWDKFFMGSPKTPMIVGLEKYNVSDFYNKTLDKINNHRKIELKFGDFCSMPLESSSVNRMLGLYGIFSYGSNTLDEDFGVKMQVEEVFRVMKSGGKCRVILIPADIKDVNDLDSGFIVTDAITKQTTIAPILKYFKKTNIDYKLVHYKISNFQEIYPPVFELTINK